MRKPALDFFLLRASPVSIPGAAEAPGYQVCSPALCPSRWVPNCCPGHVLARAGWRRWRCFSPPWGLHMLPATASCPRFILSQRLRVLQQHLNEGHNGGSLPLDAAASSKPAPHRHGIRQFLPGSACLPAWQLTPESRALECEMPLCTLQHRCVLSVSQAAVSYPDEAFNAGNSLELV